MLLNINVKKSKSRGVYINVLLKNQLKAKPRKSEKVEISKSININNAF